MTGLKWKIGRVYRRGDNRLDTVGVTVAVGDGRDAPETFTLEQAEVLAHVILDFVWGARRERAAQLEADEVES